MLSPQNSDPMPCRPVTVESLMRRACAVKGYQPISEIVDELNSDRQIMAVPVVDDVNRCIGVLTATDVRRYQKIMASYHAGDVTSLDFVFDTDRFGMRRVNFESSDLVSQHMTRPAVTIGAAEPFTQALDLLRQYEEIHHLIVVDHSGRPVGVVEKSELTNELPSPTPDDR